MSGRGVTFHCLADDEARAGPIARILGLPVSLVPIHRFPDGETLPRVGPAGDVAILYRSLDRPDDRLFPLALICDALRRAGARRIVLVAPYLPYMRQDAVFTPGEPVSQSVLASFLRTVADRIVTVDAHLHRTADLSELFAPASIDNLSSARAVAEWLRQGGRTPDIVVGPDIESGPWVRGIAAAAGIDWLTMRKTRRGDTDVDIALEPGRPLAGRQVLLADDICSTGATMHKAIAVLLAEHVAAVELYVTHALFDASQAAALRRAGAVTVVSSDSVAHPSNAVTLSHVLADALRSEFGAVGQ